MNIDFGPVFARSGLLIDGLLLTLQFSLTAIVTGFVAGTLIAVGSRSKNRLLSLVCQGYVEAIRNTPLLVQLLVVYFGLSSVGLKFPVFFVVILAMTINNAAYTAEIMRAGLDSIAKAQIEAANSLALSPWQVFSRVMLPPAIERVYRSLSSQFVLMMLSSSITSQISAEELMAAGNFIQSETFRPFETYIVLAVLYLILSLLFRGLFWAFGQVAFPRRRRLGTSL